MKTAIQNIQKEEKELSRLRKVQSKGTSGKYFLVLIMLIAIVNILDEVTSNLTVTVQSSFVTNVINLRKLVIFSIKGKLKSLMFFITRKRPIFPYRR